MVKPVKVEERPIPRVCIPNERNPMFGRFSMRGGRPFSYLCTKVMAMSFFTRSMPARLDNRGNMYMAYKESMPHLQRRADEVARVEKLAEWQPVFNHAVGRPPMIKRNGGLRGSTATKAWRR